MLAKRYAGRILFTMAMFAVMLTGCATKQSALDPKGPIAQEQMDLISLSFWVMMGVCAVVLAILLFVLIRYRKREGQDAPPKQVEGNLWLEVIWTVIPVILIIILAVPTVTGSFSTLETDEDALVVKVTGHQYWWEFEYPDHGIVTANEMHIPAGERVTVILESADVVHAFWVPKLAGKVDMAPGRTHTMPIQADEPGVYYGQCAELCGASHALMLFQVVAHEQGDFDQWVASMKEPAPEPQTELAQRGDEIFKQSCASCHAIEGTEYAGQAGPDLTRFASRDMLAAGIMENNEENLAEWLHDFEEIKPSNLMQLGQDLTDDEVEALVEYLMTLE